MGGKKIQFMTFAGANKEIYLYVCVPYTVVPYVCKSIYPTSSRIPIIYNC